MIRIGISVTSAYQVDEVRDGADRMIQRVKTAAAAGLDSLFVGDHHAVPTPYYQNTPMLGRLLADWNNNPAGALFLLPLWNPVLIAEQTATLACIHGGRFIMQCGLGAGEPQFKAMGANIRHRPSAFEQSLDTIRQLWAGESVDLNGRWVLEGARISPTPPEPIDVWIGASAPVSIERAAKLGDAWLASPGTTLEQAKGELEIYTEALGKLNKATPETIAIRRDIYVAESGDDATEVRELITQSGYRGIGPTALMIGTSEEVAAQMTAFGEAGYTDIIIRNLHRDPVKAVASTGRLAEVKSLLS